jgi:tRNA G18 (ribose-2'-O)-methylase SpoU
MVLYECKPCQQVTPLFFPGAHTLNLLAVFFNRIQGAFRLTKTGRNRSLIFGNESRGLPVKFNRIGQRITIKHSEEIDSLNISVAAGIALYEATKG